jgi:hypothetical protein
VGVDLRARDLQLDYDVAPKVINLDEADAH